MNKRTVKNSIWIALSYLIFGFGWIYYSDRIALKLWFEDAEQLSKVQSEKGFVFVALSALLIGLMTYVFNRRIEAYNTEREENFSKLQKQLRQNSLLINSTNDLIWSINREKELISFNKSFVSLIRDGFNVNVQPGDPALFDGIDDDLRKLWNGWYDRVLSGETFSELSDFEVDGKTYYLDVSFYPVYSEGQLVSASMFANDISSIKWAELEKEATIEELKNQETFIKSTLDNLTLGIAVNDIDTGEVTYSNSQFDNIYGWDREDLTDVETFFQRVYPDEEYRKEIQTRIMADMTSGDPDRMHWEGVHITTKKGEKRVVDAVNIPLPELGLMVSTVWDVTTTYRKAEELEESRAYLDILSKQASDAIVSCDENGVIQFTNTRFAQLFESNEIHPVPSWPKEYGLIHIYNNKPLSSSEVCLSIALRDGFLKNYRYRLLVDGREKILEANGSSLVDGNGKPKGAMVVIRDVTEQVHNQIQQTMVILEAVDKERSVIARNIHDGLTQQIATTYLNLNNLRNPHALDEEDHKNFNSAVKLLKETIQESREIAHNLMPESIRDYGLIEGLKGFVKRMNSASDKIQVHFDYNTDKRIKPSKEYNVYRIIQQACANAISHSNCTDIWIRLKFDDNMLLAEIEDNGDGIDLELPAGKGIGILSMRKRAQKFNGKFDIDGRDSEGTVVRIEIPLAD